MKRKLLHNLHFQLKEAYKTLTLRMLQYHHLIKAPGEGLPYSANFI